MTQKKVLQRNQLLAALQAGPITTLEARERHGILHPAGRVFDLRNDGFPIVTQWCRQELDGQWHRVGQYILQTGDGAQS